MTTKDKLASKPEAKPIYDPAGEVQPRPGGDPAKLDAAVQASKEIQEEARAKRPDTPEGQEALQKELERNKVIAEALGQPVSPGSTTKLTPETVTPSLNDREAQEKGLGLRDPEEDK